MHANLKNFFRELWRARAVRLVLVPWGAVFLILQFANTQDGGPNAVSRFLTLRAMGEEMTFRIDKRIGASADWSQTPDGHYYCNKAPGPMLLGFPAFFVVDQIPRLWEKGYRDEHGHRHTPGYFSKTWTSFFNQIVPILLLLAVILRWLDAQGIRRTTQTYFTLAVLFGSTVSLYYNNYSGHAFEALLQLGALYALLRGHYAWVGFFAGGALLSDYEFTVQIPAFVAALGWILWSRQEWVRPLLRLSLGAVVPAVLWIWYHTSAFGSPFLVTTHFQNPIFLDTLSEEANFLGVFRAPNFGILKELLVGPSRGILVTQPWILALLPLVAWPFIVSKAASPAGTRPFLAAERRACAIFCVLSLAALLVVNMSYGGWHGGGAAGPRYLSGVFLCFALWLAIEFDTFPDWMRYLFWALLAVSLAFRVLVFGSTILGPNAPLWAWYIEEFAKPSKTAESRAALFMVLMAGGYFWQRKLMRRA